MNKRYLQGCRKCWHSTTQHSIYRPLCLIKGCDCTQVGGLTDAQIEFIEDGWHVSHTI